MMNSMTNSFFCMCLMALGTKYFAYENDHVWPLIAAAAMLLSFYLGTLLREARYLSTYAVYTSCLSIHPVYTSCLYLSIHPVSRRDTEANTPRM